MRTTSTHQCLSHRKTPTILNDGWISQPTHLLYHLLVKLPPQRMPTCPARPGPGRHSGSTLSHHLLSSTVSVNLDPINPTSDRRLLAALFDDAESSKREPYQQWQRGPQDRAPQVVSFFARHRYLGLYRPPHSKLYWNPLGFMKHSFPPSSIPSSSPIWQVTSSHSVLDLTIAGSLLHQTAPFPPAGHPLWRVITLLLLLEWPLYWDCPFEPEGAFHWNCMASNIQSNLYTKILLPTQRVPGESTCGGHG